MSGEMNAGDRAMVEALASAGFDQHMMYETDSSQRCMKQDILVADLKSALLSRLAALCAERDALAEQVLEALDGLAMTAVEYDSDAFGLPSMVERNTGRAEGVRRAIEVMRTTLAAARADERAQWAARATDQERELVGRLMAAGRDERLSTGALYLEAAGVITTLLAALTAARGKADESFSDGYALGLKRRAEELAANKRLLDAAPRGAKGEG